MSILERIRQRAHANLQHIVLPEGDDPRTVIAAAACTQQRLARITLLGDEAKIRETAQRERVDLGGVEVIDHRRAPDFEKMVSMFQELRRAKGMMTDEARTTLKDPLYYGKPDGAHGKGRWLSRRSDEHNFAHGARRASLHRRAPGIQAGVQLFLDVLARPRLWT